MPISQRTLNRCIAPRPTTQGQIVPPVERILRNHLLYAGVTRPTRGPFRGASADIPFPLERIQPLDARHSSCRAHRPTLQRWPVCVLVTSMARPQRQDKSPVPADVACLVVDSTTKRGTVYPFKEPSLSTRLTRCPVGGLVTSMRRGSPRQDKEARARRRGHSVDSATREEGP